MGDLGSPCKPAAETHGYHDAWKGGPRRVMHTSRLSFPFQGALLCYLFFWCISFLASSRRSENQLCNACPPGTAPTDPQDSQQGFNPLTGGAGRWVTTGRPKPWRGDWAVRARSSAGLFVGLVLWRRARRIARECMPMVCYGRRCQTSNFQRLLGGWWWCWCCRDPGDSRQCVTIGALLSSHLQSARPPVRPSAVLLLVVAEATGHCDG